jgi:uncharacterized membrane protein
MKKFLSIAMGLILILSMFTISFAETGNSDLEINILSPNGIKDYPGHEDIVKVSITNNGDHPLNEVLVYITMADLGKNMTVNLEDYGADKPVYLDTIKAKETVEVELPIRFVYTSNYHLYVTVVTKEGNQITSSNAVPIEILGNTKINKPLAMGVAIAEPLILLGFVGIVYGMRKKKYKAR